MEYPTRTPAYVSIDIETTGLDSKNHQILEFAACAWTNDGPVRHLPVFHTIVRPSGDIRGCPFALNLNKRIIEALINPSVGKRIDATLNGFRQWLTSLGVDKDNKINVIGQNFASFDLNFLLTTGFWPEDLFTHRVFDISTIVATVDGMGSASILRAPDIPGSPHEALFDARVAMYHARRHLWKKESELDDAINAINQANEDAGQV
jgi:hypothetical protein